ncbi:sensor histidine kinase [Hansschlegelia zhihuaiae]|nr:ATP-binding protein [Hansschlegelia zhihuaiae]
MAAAIFAVDTLAPIDGAVAVLYVLVVFLAGRSHRPADIVAAGLGCPFLTAASYAATHGFERLDASTLRAFVAMSAITIASFLAWQNQAATATLAKQAQLLELSHDMIFVRDLKGAITYWNAAAEQAYGWTRAEALGEPADGLLRTRYPAERGEVEAELLRVGRWEGELVQLRRDGETLSVASRWAVQRNRQGAPVAVLETHTDVTERKRARQAMREAQAELAHAVRVSTLGELSASIAHEVKQPLTAIVTSGEAAARWLRRDVPDLAEASAAVARAVAEGKRAAQVVDRIRTFLTKDATFRAGVDLAALLEEAAGLVEHELQKHDVLLEMEIAPDLPPIEGDPVRLQQVAVNLLVNAAQAMSGQADVRRLSLRAARDADCDGVLVAVSDSGPGLPGDDFEGVFRPFFTTRPEGMGMGLAICRSTIEAHGGRLWAENGSGGGAVFSFTLPVPAAGAEG